MFNLRLACINATLNKMTPQLPRDGSWSPSCQRVKLFEPWAIDENAATFSRSSVILRRFFQCIFLSLEDGFRELRKLRDGHKPQP